MCTRPVRFGHTHTELGAAYSQWPRITCVNVLAVLECMVSDTTGYLSQALVAERDVCSRLQRNGAPPLIATYSHQAVRLGPARPIGTASSCSTMAIWSPCWSSSRPRPTMASAGNGFSKPASAAAPTGMRPCSRAPRMPRVGSASSCAKGHRTAQACLAPVAFCGSPSDQELIEITRDPARGAAPDGGLSRPRWR